MEEEIDRNTDNGAVTTKFKVTFRLHYETVPGEDLFVVGNIPELGTIEERRHSLKWTEGHIWVSTKPLITRRPTFQYNYVMVGPQG